MSNEPSTGIPQDVLYQDHTVKAEGILRESSPKQAQSHKQGLDQQRNDIIEYARRFGIEIVRWEIVVESASTWERPVWEGVVQGVINRHLRRENDAIVFDRIDRETRNLLASAPILKEALKAGLKVYFAAEEFELDPRDPEALDQYFDKADEARSYAKAISKGWRRVHHTRARKEKHPTNQWLFAFCYDEQEKRTLDEALVPTAREAINLFLKDGHLSPVVRWLQSQGHYIRRRGLNSPSALRRWLENPALKGETLACGEVIHHDRLVDPSIWDQIQSILKANKGSRSPRKGYLPIPFRCGCGTRMKADKSGPRVYVHCKHCGKPYLRLDRLLSMINLATVVYVQEKRDFFGDLSVKAEVKEGVLAELDEISKALKPIEARWKSVGHKLGDEKLRDWQKKILEEEEQSLTSQHAVLEERQNRLLDRLKELPEMQVIDIQKAWEDAIAPYEVHFTRLSPTPPTLDKQKPDELALKLLLQGPPSPFYEINNLKPYYLDVRGSPKPSEGCVVPEPPSTQDIGVPSSWGSEGFHPLEQFKSVIPLDGWVWDLLRDLRAEALIDHGRVKLRFQLKVIPHRLNRTPWCTSPG